MGRTNYTGPATAIPFKGRTGKTEFFLTLAVSAEDPEAIKRIVKRYAEDGYEAQLDKRRSFFMRDGMIEDPDDQVGPVGFPRRSAFIRA